MARVPAVPTRNRVPPAITGQFRLLQRVGDTEGDQQTPALVVAGQVPGQGAYQRDDGVMRSRAAKMDDMMRRLPGVEQSFSFR